MTSPVERNQIVPRITRMKPMRIVIFDALLVILLVLFPCFAFICRRCGPCSGSSALGSRR